MLRVGAGVHSEGEQLQGTTFRCASSRPLLCKAPRQRLGVVLVKVRRGLIKSQDATIQAKGLGESQPDDDGGQHLHGKPATTGRALALGMTEQRSVNSWKKKLPFVQRCSAHACRDPHRLSS